MRFLGKRKPKQRFARWALIYLRDDFPHDSDICKIKDANIADLTIDDQKTVHFQAAKKVARKLEKDLPGWNLVPINYSVRIPESDL